MSERHHPFTCTKCWQDRWEELKEAEGERRAQVLWTLSGYAYRAKQFGHALELAQESLDIYLTDANRREEQADALTSIASALWGLERKDEAYLHLRTALDIYRETNPSYSKVWENQLCWWLFQDELYEESLAAYQHTLELNRAEKDDEATSFDLLMIGRCLFYLERHADSIPYFHEARDLAKGNGDHRHTAMADFNIGEAYVYLGDGFEGEIYCRKALTIFEQYGHQTYIAETHKMIGMAQSLQGQYEEAIASLRRAASGFSTADEKNFEEIVATNTELIKNLRIVGAVEEAQAIEVRTSTIKELL